MRKLILGIILLLSLTRAAAGQAPQNAPRSCEDLAQLSLPGAKISLAQSVAAGAFLSPPTGAPLPASEAAFYKTLPSFCRIAAEATPSADSSIQIEVWLPAATEGLNRWNGKFRGQGNGGFAGEIFYHGMGWAILQGYATASTDTGHTGAATDAKWALGHPEKVTDFGYRGIHEMTRVAKAVIHAYYAADPQHSYFIGCSNGGRQALMEAQRFPGDYDGLLAGAPANSWTQLLTSAIWDAQALTLDDASYIPPSKIPAIARAVNEACDAQDGVTDGILNDPRKCHFDPAMMLCKAGDSDSCLTAPQVATLKKLYQGARGSAGRQIFPGFTPGGEDGPGGWGLWVTGTAPGRSLLFAFGNGFFANMVYGKADWNYKDVSLEQAFKMAEEKTARDLNANDPNLAAFKARGGKLILFHGWNDAAISALSSVDYFEAVKARLGAGAADEFVRLYMVPGVQHCNGGPGPGSFGQSGGLDAKDSQHNIQLSLEQWVEAGRAPSAIIASKYQGEGSARAVKLTRPLCPYPQVANYKGGDPNDAASFVCGATADDPKKRP